MQLHIEGSQIHTEATRRDIPIALRRKNILALEELARQSGIITEPTPAPPGLVNAQIVRGARIEQIVRYLETAGIQAITIEPPDIPALLGRQMTRTPAQS